MADPLSNLGGGLGTRSNPAARLGYTMVFERRGQAHENRRAPLDLLLQLLLSTRLHHLACRPHMAPHRIARAFPSSDPHDKEK